MKVAYLYGYLLEFEHCCDCKQSWCTIQLIKHTCYTV